MVAQRVAQDFQMVEKVKNKVRSRCRRGVLVSRNGRGSLAPRLCSPRKENSAGVYFASADVHCVDQFPLQPWSARACCVICFYRIASIRWVGSGFRLGDDPAEFRRSIRAPQKTTKKLFHYHENIRTSRGAHQRTKNHATQGGFRLTHQN